MFDLIFGLIGFAWSLLWLALYLLGAYALLAVYAKIFHGNIARMVFHYLNKWVVDRRDPDLNISHINGGLYLRRWYVLPRNGFFNIYLHNFVGDDHPVAHDHPWWSLSYALKGEMIEYQADGDFNFIKEGDWRFRSATYAHYLALLSEDGVKQPAWTLFMTGPRLRRWGFHCPKGWMWWGDYMDVETGVIHGCGELS